MSTAITITELEKQVAIYRQQADIVKIETADDYRDAQTLTSNIVRLCKSIDQTFDPIIAKAHETHAEAIRQKRKFSDPLKLLLGFIDQKSIAWRNRQEMIRRDQEARLAAQMQKQREDQALAEAQELVRQGEHALADEVIRHETESPAPVVSIPSVVPKVESFTTKKAWRYRISDKNRDPKTSIIPDEFWIIDETRVAGLVRTLKASTNIPGVEVYAEDTAVHRVR